MVSKKFLKTPVSIFHSKANDFSLVIFSRLWMQYVIKVDFFFLITNPATPYVGNKCDNMRLVAVEFYSDDMRSLVLILV